jgi:hypothetical protein
MPSLHASRKVRVATDFSRGCSCFSSGLLLLLVELLLILGGAAVYRCDNSIVVNAALAAEGTPSAPGIRFKFRMDD